MTSTSSQGSEGRRTSRVGWLPVLCGGAGLVAALAIALAPEEPSRPPSAAAPAAAPAATDLDLGSGPSLRVAVAPAALPAVASASAPNSTPVAPRGNYAALLEAAQLTGASVEEIAAILERLNPAWFDQELAPLMSWEAAKQHAAAHFVNVFVSLSPAVVNEHFEMELLGARLEDYLAELALPPERETAVRQDLVARLSELRPEFERWRVAGRLAIEHKVGLERYDHWPRVTIDRLRTHTGFRRSLTMAASGGLVDAHGTVTGWIVQLDLYRGEYPEFDTIHAAWRELAAEFRAELAALVAAH